jgi:hypothetical protein
VPLKAVLDQIWNMIQPLDFSAKPRIFQLTNSEIWENHDAIKSGIESPVSERLLQYWPEVVTVVPDMNPPQLTVLPIKSADSRQTIFKNTLARLKDEDWPRLAPRFTFSMKDNLSSYLGRKNPFYANVNPNTHYVWVLDTTAYQDRLGRWKAEFITAYFVKDSAKNVAEVVAWVGERIGLADDELARETISQRLQPFTDQILPAHSVQIDLLGLTTRLGPSGRDGISVDELRIPANGYEDGQIITLNAISDAAPPVNITFAKPKGWAVLSSIDDTIKKTLTSLPPVRILGTTFAEEPEPVQGMPELYNQIVQSLESPPFQYLSASPYNLYPLLRNFRKQHYPNGTIILRNTGFRDLGTVLETSTQGTETYKIDHFEKILRWFPKRKFILIGDSTQADPESYGESYRRFNKWVGAIYIRKVTHVGEIDEGKNNPERFEKAFKGVPKNIWYILEDPKEFYAKIAGLAKS